MNRKTSRRPLAIMALALIFAALACTSEDEPLQSDLPPAEEATQAAPAADWYSLYFTDPTAEFQEAGPDEALAAAIDAARLSVDMAVYELDLDSVGEALIRAHERGVNVRIVTDSDYLDEDAMQAVIDAGIPVLGDRREGYMHNKFTVIDRSEVWGGSMNYTSNDAYRNNNNLIRIRSTKLAEDYTTEFEEMFSEDLFGPDDRAATPYPNLTINGTAMEVYFSPDDGVADHLIELIQGAKESIYFLAFSFTSDDLGDAILERYDAGVSVAGVFEESQYNSNGKSSEFDRMRTAGLDVWLDANPRNQHSKVIIIDGQIVVTGSYNFSSNAEKTNDENVMVLYNSDIAARYTAEFQKILNLAKK